MSQQQINHQPHPEEHCAAMRLEGWPRVRAVQPSFETAARARPPRDEVCPQQGHAPDDPAAHANQRADARAQRLHRAGAAAAIAGGGGREGAASRARYAWPPWCRARGFAPGGPRSPMCAGSAARAQASVVGSRVVTSCVNAALANGMLAHADETDDSHAPSRNHPGCAVVPAALAAAESRACERRAVPARGRARL